MTRIRLPMLNYHSKCSNFSLESFSSPMTKFICPGWTGPVFMLDRVSARFHILALRMHFTRSNICIVPPGLEGEIFWLVQFVS